MVFWKKQGKITAKPHENVFRQFAEFFPPGMVTLHFCDHVFRTLDTDGNGYLDFKVDELKLTPPP